MTDFGRLITAMVTPFDDNLAVDYNQARAVARHLIETGSDSIVVAGTTGESPTLTKEEKLELFRVVVNEVGGRAKVIAGTGSNNTAESAALTREAEKTGVHGVMLVAPYYNKPPQEGLYRHFKAIAGATSLPVMLYNVPGRTVTNLMPATVARLAEIDNIFSLKEACGNLDQISELRITLPDDFIIYSGDDSLTLPMLSVGCYGVVSVVGHVVGRQMQEMIGAFTAGDHKRAWELHLKLFPVFKALFVTTSPIPVKAAMNMTGIDVGGLRPPLVAAGEKEAAVIAEALKGVGVM
ncbi:MAG: 4-hydroxy-tetrahydrodipicolinate synthase [Bacillota bacterium]